MKNVWSFLLCLCVLLSVPCVGFAEDIGLDEYRAVAAQLFGMTDGLLGAGGEAASEAGFEEAQAQYRSTLSKVPPSSFELFSGALSAVDEDTGMLIPIPGGKESSLSLEKGTAEDAKAAAEAYRMMIDQIPDMPVGLLGGQGVLPVSDKEIKVMNTMIYVTLPADAYLYSSTEETDETSSVLKTENWTSPSLGILISFAKMKYYPLGTWETVLESDGYTITTGSIGGVSLVSGQKKESGYFRLSYVYEHGGFSYVISAVNMTYDQAISFINVMRTLRSAAQATPTPVPVIKSKTEVILDTRAQIDLPLDMNSYSELENGEIWKCLSTGLLLGFFESDYASYSTWKEVLEADGCETGTGYINNVFVVSGKKYIDGKGHQLTYYFNDAQRSFCIMGTSMSDAQLTQMIEIVQTLNLRMSSSTPAPSVSLTKDYRILNTRVTVKLPEDMKFHTAQNGSEYWYSSGYKLLVGFSRKKLSSLSAWKDALETQGYDTGERDFGDISVISGDKYIEDEGYARTYVFNYEGFSYVLVGAKLTSMQMHVMLEIIRTVDMGDAEPELILPQDLQEIGESAFASCGAVVVLVPQGCTSIGACAFADNDDLIKIVIPASVTDIAADAFDGSDGVAIYAPAGSAAIAFAKEAGILYVEQDTDD